MIQHIKYKYDEIFKNIDYQFFIQNYKNEIKEYYDKLIIYNAFLTRNKMNEIYNLYKMAIFHKLPRKYLNIRN